jgi:hypothetical protein
MTAKEKAKNLVNEYRIMLMQTDTDAGLPILCTSIAKQCALIALDEIWNALEGARVFEEYDYWNEVKKEIICL